MDLEGLAKTFDKGSSVGVATNDFLLSQITEFTSSLAKAPSYTLNTGFAQQPVCKPALY